MRKVNLQVIRPWIAKKVVELVGLEDEVVVEYAMGLLEDKQQPVRPIHIQDRCSCQLRCLQTPDPKKMQINLTGFLPLKKPALCIAHWSLRIERQDSAD